MAKINKSDKGAKKAYRKELLNNRGYCKAEIVNSPVDIIAYKDGVEWYFEIKKTTKEHYFGAATQTEWAQALEKPQYFRFVIAKTDEQESRYEFFEYTPEQFMEYSTIPPFKIYFNIDLTKPTKKRRCNKKSKSLKLTRKTFKNLNDVFCKLKNQL